MLATRRSAIAVTTAGHESEQTESRRCIDSFESRTKRDRDCFVVAGLRGGAVLVKLPQLGGAWHFLANANFETDGVVFLENQSAASSLVPLGKSGQGLKSQ